MLIRKAATVLIVAFLAFGTFASGRDGIIKRVRFAKGKISITLSNAVIRGDRDTYILGAKAGQRMTVQITSVEDNAVFQIEVRDRAYLDGACEIDDATSVTVRLPTRAITACCRRHAGKRILQASCIDSASN